MMSPTKSKSNQWHSVPVAVVTATIIWIGGAALMTWHTSAGNADKLVDLGARTATLEKIAADNRENIARMANSIDWMKQAWERSGQSPINLK